MKCSKIREIAVPNMMHNVDGNIADKMTPMFAPPNSRNDQKVKSKEIASE